jgi:hypothetical protein
MSAWILVLLMSSILAASAYKLSTSPSSSIFISSFSSIYNSRFRDIVWDLSNRKPHAATDRRQKLIYIPTATFTFNAKSLKSRGEQRRRAKYEAKQKMKLLAESFDVETMMLELDDPKLHSASGAEVAAALGTQSRFMSPVLSLLISVKLDPLSCFVLPLYRLLLSSAALQLSSSPALQLSSSPAL